MRLGFLLIFIAVPLIELALLIKLGGWIGIWPTLGLIVLTAIVGTALLRQQGFKTLNKVVETLQAGKAPVVPMVEGALLLIAGAFLLTPGILTDLTGGALLVPAVRERLAAWIVRNAVAQGMVRVRTGTGFPPGDEATGPGGRPDPRRPQGHRPASGADRPGPAGRTSPGPIIEGDFERLDEKTYDPSRKRRD